VKTLVADVSAKFKGVFTDDFADTIEQVINVAGLGEAPVGIVAKGESTRQRDKWQAFATGSISWSDTQTRVGRIGEALVRRHCSAGVLQQLRVLRR